VSIPEENHFDAVAGIYDGLARLVFADRLIRAQTTWLEHIPAHSEIAIVGGGSGELLDAMAETITEPRAVHYIDASLRMVELARARVSTMASKGGDRSAFAEALHFAPLALEQWHAERPLDVLITPFLLDCFDGERLEQTIKHLAGQLRPGGLWLLTDFTPSKLPVHRLTMAMMYAFFRLSAALSSKKLEPYFDLVTRHGFRALRQSEFSTLAGPVRSALFTKGTGYRDTKVPSKQIVFAQAQPLPHSAEVDCASPWSPQA